MKASPNKRKRKAKKAKDNRIDDTDDPSHDSSSDSESDSTSSSSDSEFSGTDPILSQTDKDDDDDDDNNSNNNNNNSNTSSNNIKKHKKDSYKIYFKNLKWNDYVQYYGISINLNPEKKLLLKSNFHFVRKNAKFISRMRKIITKLYHISDYPQFIIKISSIIKFRKNKSVYQ